MSIIRLASSLLVCWSLLTNANPIIPTISSDSYIPASREHPCAAVGRSFAAARGSNSSCLIGAEIAYACLRSVSLKKEANAAQLEGLKHLLQFQSTLAYLKDPPPGYMYEAVDVMQGIEQLSEDLSSGKYENEYDFQLALYSLLTKARDGHLNYPIDIVTVFSFHRPMDLLSLSVDGISLPQIYAYPDLAALQSNSTGASGYAASPIYAIQDTPIDQFLGARANVTGRSHEPDANYNGLFPNIPQGTIATGKLLSNMVAHIYSGPSTTFSFSNGTNLTLRNYASTLRNLSHIKDDESFFKETCSYFQNALANVSHGDAKNDRHLMKPNQPIEDRTTFTNRYPDPVVIDEDAGSIAGYYSDVKDLAVLSVPSFMSKHDSAPDFIAKARDFLCLARAAGKKRLIVDLRGNRGGLIYLGYGLFKVIFPDSTPFAATNLRASPLLDSVGKFLSETKINSQGDVDSGLRYSSRNYTRYPPWLSYRLSLNTELEHFDSWQEYYGPHTHGNDNFTSVTRNNFSSMLVTGDLPIPGYSDESAQEMFSAENVILLQDGLCASTCATFTEAAKIEAGVRQVVVGGRPQPGPMQGVGGVKGGQVVSFTELNAVITISEALGDLSELAYKDINATLNRQRRAPGSVNLRNTVRRGDETAMPLQFVYEAADCRLFYTADMYDKQDNVWRAAYEAVWGDGLCVPGSTGHPSSTSDVHSIAGERRTDDR